jgi:hypothetical protein
MKTLAIIVSLLGFAAVACAQTDEKPIRVVGVVSFVVFPGRPNYESIAGGDEAEQAWILTTAKEKKEERFQLVVADGSEQKFAALRRFVGKKVEIEGSIWEAHTGHHHTAQLITVQSIQEWPNQPSEPTPGKCLFSNRRPRPGGAHL